MRLRPIPVFAILAATALAALGCGGGDNKIDRAPVFNTGASATIIYPGESGPALPSYGYGTYGAPGQAAPQTAGSVPGQPGAQTPPAYRTNAPVRPTSNMSMLGGATTIDERQTKRRQAPMEAAKTTPLAAPVAAAAWPFKKIGDMASSNDSKSSQQQSTAATPPSSEPPSHKQIQLDHERAQLAAMEAELAHRQAMGPSQDVAPQYSSVGPPSIADELAALRAGNRAATDGALSTSPASRPTPSYARPLAPSQVADRIEDRNGDGRPDHWIHLDGALVTREVFDDDGDGQPDRTIHYASGTDVPERIEEDGNRDGHVDSWAYFKDGVLARRRADANADGVVDTWTFYEGDRMIRHEEDTNGDGFRDRIDYYEEGVLARRTEDRDGDGRPDRVTRFDSQGRPVHQEEDRDGDGEIDMRSYYSEGRLVRRELLDGNLATP